MIVPSGPTVEVATLSLSLLALVLGLLGLWRSRPARGKRVEPVPGEVTDLLARLEDLAAAQRAAVEREQRRMAAPGLVHFSAYGGEGPALSFSLVLLDAAGDGVVLTSLYGRDQVRLYTKALRNGVAEVELAEEERAALDLARSGGGHRVLGEGGASPLLRAQRRRRN